MRAFNRTTSDHTQARRERLCLIVILALTAVVYLPTLSHPFQYDDLNYILRNQQIRDPLGSFRTFIEEGYSNWTTRLISNLTLSWNYFVFGFKPTGYHATNLAIHLLNVALIWRLGRAILDRLGNNDRFLPLAAAALFALHPLNTEAVLYCNARANIVCTAFYLATMLALMDAVEAGPSRRRERIARWVFFGVLLILTLLTKELAATIVVTAPLLLLWLGSGSSLKYRAVQSRVLSLMAGLFVFGMLMIAVTGAWSYVTVTSAYTFGWSLGNYLFLNAAGQAAVFFHYLGLALVPFPSLLNVDHDIRPLYQTLDPEKGLWAGGQIEPVIFPLISLVAVIGLIVAALVLRKRMPFVSYFMLWPVLTHAPTSLVPRGEQMVEYRSYLPMVGLSLLAAFGVVRLIKFLRVGPESFAKARTATVGAITALFVCGTLQRGTVWKTQESLWTDTIRKSPKKARGYLNLGNVQETSGQLNAAIKTYSRGLAAVPRDSKLYYNRGNARAARGDLSGAIEDFTRSVQLEPEFPDAYNNRGKARFAMGAIDEAIKDYTLALARDRNHAWAYCNRAAARASKGDMNGALADCDAALKADPHLAEAHLNRGNLRAGAGDLRGAVRDYGNALLLSPELIDAYFNRGLILAKQGDLSGAARDLEHALREAPPAWPYRARAGALLQQIHAMRAKH